MSSEEIKNLNKMMEVSSQKLGEVLNQKFTEAREANQETIKTMEKLVLTINTLANYTKETRDLVNNLEKRVAVLES